MCCGPCLQEMLHLTRSARVINAMTVPRRRLLRLDVVACSCLPLLLLCGCAALKLFGEPLKMATVGLDDFAAAVTYRDGDNAVVVQVRFYAEQLGWVCTFLFLNS